MSDPIESRPDEPDNLPPRIHAMLRGFRTPVAAAQGLGFELRRVDSLPCGAKLWADRHGRAHYVFDGGSALAHDVAAWGALVLACAMRLGGTLTGAEHVALATELCAWSIAS